MAPKSREQPRHNLLFTPDSDEADEYVPSPVPSPPLEPEQPGTVGPNGTNRPSAAKGRTNGKYIRAKSSAGRARKRATPSASRETKVALERGTTADDDVDPITLDVIQLQVRRLAQDPVPKEKRLEVWIPTGPETNNAGDDDDGESDDPQAQLEREMADLVRPGSSRQQELRGLAATHGDERVLPSNKSLNRTVRDVLAHVMARDERKGESGLNERLEYVHRNFRRPASETDRKNVAGPSVIANGTGLGQPGTGRRDPYILDSEPVVAAQELLEKRDRVAQRHDRAARQGASRRQAKRRYEDSLGTDESESSATHTRSQSPPKRQRQDVRHSLAGAFYAAAAAAAGTSPIRPEHDREARRQAPRARSVPTPRVAGQGSNVPALQSVVVEQAEPSEDGSLVIEDDSILLESPSAIDPSQQIALTGKRIAKMYKLMGKSGWTNNGAKWEKEFRLDMVSGASTQVSSHNSPPNTKIGKKFWVHLTFLENLIRRMPKFYSGEGNGDGNGNGLCAQNAYIQKHEPQVKNSFATINQLVVKICERHLAVLSDFSNKRNDNGESQLAVVDDFVRFLVPKLVYILGEAFALGGVEKDDMGSGLPGFFSCSTLDFLVRTADWIWRLSGALDSEMVWRLLSSSVLPILSQSNVDAPPPEQPGDRTDEQSMGEAPRTRAATRKLETARKRLEQQRWRSEQAAMERGALCSHIIALRRSIKDAISAAEEEGRRHETEEQKRRRARRDEEVALARRAVEERERQRALRQNRAFCAYTHRLRLLPGPMAQRWNKAWSAQTAAHPPQPPEPEPRQIDFSERLGDPAGVEDDLEFEEAPAVTEYAPWSEDENRFLLHKLRETVSQGELARVITFVAKGVDRPMDDVCQQLVRVQELVRNLCRTKGVEIEVWARE